MLLAVTTTTTTTPTMRAAVVLLAAVLCAASGVAVDRQHILEKSPKLPSNIFVNSTAHEPGDTSSMFYIVDRMLTDPVVDQYAVENAYSRVFTKKDGKPCKYPGNGYWDAKSVFDSPTNATQRDQVFKWRVADSECSLRYDGVHYEKELANATILFIGNSVSRGTFWQLASLIDLDGMVQEVDRIMQKKFCSKHARADISCHLKPKSVPNSYFSWIQELNDLAKRVEKIKAQIKTPVDIVVFNLGLQHLLFDREAWYPHLMSYMPDLIEAFNTHMPNARKVYLPVSPANENNDRVRNRFHLTNKKVIDWDREMFDLISAQGWDWLPVCEPVMRGWSQELAYDRYGYLDHFHPAPHVYTLWNRMLMSVLAQPPQEGNGDGNGFTPIKI